MHKYLVRHLANKSKLPDKLAGSGADRQLQGVGMAPGMGLSRMMMRIRLALGGQMARRLIDAVK